MVIENESRFQSFTLRALQKLGFATEVHDPGTGGKGGIPDTSYGIALTNGWMEFKWGKLGVLKTSQSKWLDNRSRNGGYCFVLWGFTDYIVVFDIRAHHSIRINSWQTVENMQYLAQLLLSGTPQHGTKNKLNGTYTYKQFCKFFKA